MMKMVKAVCKACRSVDRGVTESVTGEGFDWIWSKGKIMCPQQAEDVITLSALGNAHRYVELPPPDKCPFMTEHVVGQE
jgi:hypothetical protein